MSYARVRGNTWSARWRTREGLPAEKGGFETRKLAINSKSLKYISLSI
jgi:hypothetical protein